MKNCRERTALLVLLTALLLAVTVSACVTGSRGAFGKKNKTATPFIAPEVKLTRGKVVREYHIVPNTDFSAYRSFHIPAFQNYTGTNVPEVVLTSLGQELAIALGKEGSGRIGVIDRSPAVTSPSNDLMVEAAVVELLQRDDLGTKLTVEGRLLEAKGGRVLALFRHTEQVYGYSVGFENPPMEAITLVADHLANFTTKVLKGEIQNL
ncbi:MAG: hypothetical protein HYV63_23080 [Candidatus Schekmanbacteria bacterium]|nr:hypothetical protein [Candidatus Schekmanbacteria bacterium]